MVLVPPWTEEKITEMKAMSYSETVQFFIDEYVIASDKGRCEYAGEYPCNWKRIHGYVFVAEVDYSRRPTLKVYPNQDIVNWTKRMITYLKSEIGKDDASDILDAYAITEKIPHVRKKHEGTTS